MQRKEEVQPEKYDFSFDKKRVARPGNRNMSSKGDVAGIRRPVNAISMKLLIAVLLAIIGQLTHANGEIPDRALDRHVCTSTAATAFIQLADQDDTRNKQTPQPLNRESSIYGSMESLRASTTRPTRRPSSGALAQNTLDFLRYFALSHACFSCVQQISQSPPPPFFLIIFDQQNSCTKMRKKSWLFLTT